MDSTNGLDLPDDLKVALREVKKQYRVREIKGVEGPEFKEDLLSFIPDPEADESWVGGQIVFGEKSSDDKNDSEKTESREIVEYDPDDGRIYIEASQSPLFKQAITNLSKYKLSYRPFDFSLALVGAFDQLKNHPELLKAALDRSCGYFDGPNLSEQTTISPLNITSGPKQPFEGMASIWRLPWAMVWGPPGTGKTEAVARACANYAADHGNNKILITTPTNLSADEAASRICKLLKERGRTPQDGDCLVYRGGRGAGKNLSREFPECLRDKAYARLYDKKKNTITLLKDERDEARHKRDHVRSSQLSKEIKELEASLPDETQFVIEQGKSKIIILTTFKACSFVGKGDNPVLFEKVIIDEAGMVSRATCAAVSSLGKTSLLAGDPKQIGPIFCSPEGLSKDVRKWVLASGLSHLTSVKESANDEKVLFLNKQYRMHPDISKAVSCFTYDGQLQDSDEVQAFTKEAPIAVALPKKRASYLVIDEMVEPYAKKPLNGVGWERKPSAQIAINLAVAAAVAGKGVLVITPYRAQVKLLKRLAKETKNDKVIGIGTIHRHQGAERDVVIVDLVRAALSWTKSERAMLLNVAMSRAKRQFILLASRDELATPVLNQLIAHLKQESISMSVLDEVGGQKMLQFDLKGVEVKPSSQKEEIKPAKTLGDETHVFRERRPLFSFDQMKLLDRNIGDGHYLVRGVAGSGKSLILANWVVKLLEKRIRHKVLITFFNKGMQNLMNAMLQEACVRAHVDFNVINKCITMLHIDKLITQRVEQGAYDAVFVDEAQDMEPEDLKKLYYLCREQTSKDGKKLRNLILFYDDSQNIYGRKTLEELKDLLPEEFAFSGRSMVLREAYRSTRAILSFAVNMSLDPKKKYSEQESGLLQYMKVPELAKEGLLVRPEDSPEGVYHVKYTDRLGIAPIICEASDENEVFELIANEIRRLKDQENVQPGAILVITVVKPERAAEAIKKAGVLAEAYAGKKGKDSLQMPARSIPHVRCTTIFSCKGHEAPVVFFANIQEVEKISDLDLASGKSSAEKKKMKRCSLYVGASRAMIRLYVYGLKSPILEAAKTYAESESMLDFHVEPPISVATKTKSYSVVEKRVTHQNAYAKWSAEDDQKLREAIQQGMSQEESARLFQRNLGAIRSRLKKLGLMG